MVTIVIVQVKTFKKIAFQICVNLLIQVIGQDQPVKHIKWNAGQEITEVHVEDMENVDMIKFMTTTIVLVIFGGKVI